jgi:SAM-dependent methyltransferase/uncharacterized protein YbaR (Trm112 family)
MRRGHFDALAPLCPVCRGRGTDSRLLLDSPDENDPHAPSRLRCATPECQREYPVIDGLPVLVGPLREYVSQQLLSILRRDDLPEDTESLLGDCAGPGSPFDTLRQHLSTYGGSHYGDLTGDAVDPGGSAVARLTAECLDAALAPGPDDLPPGPVLDAGCAVGRSTFELAARLGDRRVLGIDSHFAFARLAMEVLTTARVRYPRRRLGVVYDRRQGPARFPAAERVDFWVTDALALPFADGTFAFALSLNLLDCVASPVDHLRELARVLAPGGRAAVATPFDWSPTATALEGWLGGHSQRGPLRGAAEPLLEALLTPGGHPASVEGLRLLGPPGELTWRLPTHARSTVEYRVHLRVVERAS